MYNISYANILLYSSIHPEYYFDKSKDDEDFISADNDPKQFNEEVRRLLAEQ
ncbi:hypothetical protein CAPN008_01430 [Capnocytophaga canis]|uniref:hypothetical protein n=1 Tax=Capnocytophaga canis TaxID=1848903 RepID=UPI001ACF51FC|nr:hypothetical protein [Capnocytophaga canis]GIM60093.1 hypothetical protein CAPN008_01430 [Capnocytophaga canis]